MPFPPISLHHRMSSPGRELFRRKKSGAPPPPPGEENKSDRERFPSSWAPSNLRNLGRKSKSPGSPADAEEPRGGGRGSWLSVSKPQVTRSGSMESSKHSSRSSLGKEAEKEVQFSLSLTPEAILVLQKRNLEKQMLARQHKCCASADFRHRRVFPQRKAHGGSRSCGPAAKPEAEQDIRAIVKISLLNEQHKYDDVEYEEEDGDVDETVLRKCREWLKGVESAAALGKVDKLSGLPRVQGC